MRISDWSSDVCSSDLPVVGRLVARGLDDELKGTAYAVVDGTDGRTHHTKLPDLDAAGDSAPGSIVELRRFHDAKGQRPIAMADRYEPTIEQQRSEAHTSELQALMCRAYDVFCMKKKTHK